MCEENELALMSPEGKCHYKERKHFCKNGSGILCHSNPGDETERVVVPHSMRTELIRMSHDLPSAGHQGVDRTKARIKSKYYWWRMSDEIHQYVLTCRLCNRNKSGKVKGKMDMRLHHAGSPMERVHIDFLGPLPKTINGNEYLLIY